MIPSRLDALLDPKHVVLELRGREAKDAVWEIVQLLAESGELRSPKEFFEAVMEREAKSLHGGEWRSSVSTFADGTRRCSSYSGLGGAKKGSRFRMRKLRSISFLFSPSRSKW